MVRSNDPPPDDRTLRDDPAVDRDRAAYEHGRAAERMDTQHGAPVTDETRRDVVVADDVKPKTSAAATFALVFGLTALIYFWLAPLAVVFGLIAIILGAVGAGKAKREWHVTGRGLAISGLVMGLIGLILGGLVLFAGFTLFSDEGVMREFEGIMQDLDRGVEPDTEGLEGEIEDVGDG